MRLKNLQHVEDAVLAGSKKCVTLDQLVHIVQIHSLPANVRQEFPEVPAQKKDIPSGVPSHCVLMDQSRVL